jgi:site-specific recombinase XerD
MPAVLYAANGGANAGLTLREIPPRPAKSQDHPWVAALLKALAREDVASVTVRGYRSDLGLFAVWYGGHPLEKLTASDLAHFRQYLSRERSMKPASVNRKLEALRRFCRWAHTSSKLRINVSAGLKLARAGRGTRPKGLLASEVQALLRAAGQSRRALARRNYAIVQLLLQAGLRVSEAAALRIEDLEIHARQGKVRREIPVFAYLCLAPLRVKTLGHAPVLFCFLYAPKKMPIRLDYLALLT